MYIVADAYIHRIDPFLIRFTDTFGIRWYGTAYALGFLIAWLLARHLATRKLINLTTQQVGDFIMTGVIGVLVGGRLGWVLFYHPPALWTFSPTFPFWELLAINRGGMASHGGMIGVMLAMLWFARRHNVKLLHLLDLSALLVPFGLFFGRLANFTNSELRGVPCDPDFPLAVKFPAEIIEDWGPDQMSQVSDASTHLGYTYTHWTHIIEQARQGVPNAKDQLLALQDRLWQEVMQGTESVSNIVIPALTARHPSQLYQAAAEGIILGLVMWLIWLLARPIRHGIIAAWFFITYGILRITTEIWRIPDAGVDRILGLSRGQLLSTAMIVLGLIILIRVKTKSGGTAQAESCPSTGSG